MDQNVKCVYINLLENEKFLKLNRGDIGMV